MKKFSTRFFSIGTIMLTGCVGVALSLFSPISFAQSSELAVAKTLAHRNRTVCEFRKDAPDSHTVVKGDTLWDISAKFLTKPWCWPQVWELNTTQIRDPHWIYPGQIIIFDRVNGKLRLGGVATIKLSPHARTLKNSHDDGALPSIPPSVIEPFLSQPLVVDSASMKDAARIIATQEGRVYLGRGETAYVKGDLKDTELGSLYQVFRPGRALKDPDSQEILAYESAYLGVLRLLRRGKNGEPDTFTVLDSKQEIGTGDRLLPLARVGLLNYVPHAPATEIKGRVISVYGGVTQAGSNMIVAINRGKEHGLEIGHVFEISRYGATIKDRTDNDKKVKLPDEKFGNLFVFRVFEKISYALVMQVTEPVQVGDIIQTPE